MGKKEVNLGQIERESAKATKTRKYEGTVIPSSDDDDSEEAGGRLSKILIHFKNEGLVISAYDLHTIETDMRFVEKPKAHWEYGIAINKGLTPSQYINKTNIFIWFLHEEVRDDKMDKIMKTLKREGINVIEL